MSKTDRRNRFLLGNLIAQVILAVIVGLLLACNVRVEGCLDIEASNFDITVDINDPDVCNYPDLILKVQYSWDTLSFSKDDFFTNDLGQQMAFNDLYLLVSQFALNGVELGHLVVENRTDWFLKEGDGGEYIKAIDDFTFVDYSKFSFVLGEWRTTDFVDRLDFFAGVPDTLTPTDVDSLNDDHVLREARTFYSAETNEFASARFIIARDSARIELDTFVISSGPLAYSFPLSQQLNRGKNDNIEIKIDFYSIFRDVDLDQDSTSIAQQLAVNLKGAISN
jgi:hypothetical protein